MSPEVFLLFVGMTEFVMGYIRWLYDLRTFFETNTTAKLTQNLSRIRIYVIYKINRLVVVTRALIWPVQLQDRFELNLVWCLEIFRFDRKS